MVLQKKLYYGFNGYQIPPMPRGSRSVRGKRSVPKKNKENPLFAFEMLAMVAGKLLLEKETSKLSSIVPVCSKLPKSTIKHESWKVEKQLKVEPCDQGSCDESTLASESQHERIDQIIKLKEGLKCSQSVIQQPAPLTVKSELCMRTHKELRFPIVKSSKDDEIGDSFTSSGNRCAQTYSPVSSESHVTKIEDETQVPMPTDRLTVTNVVDGTGVNLFCMEDPMILDPKPLSMDSSDSSVEARPTGLYISNNHFIANDHDRVELVDRDDDENSSRCTLPSTIFLKAFRSQHTEDRKTRKLMASKFWKVGPTLLRDNESSNNDEHVKSIFRSRRMCYTRQRSQRSSFKRKKLLEHGPLPSSGCSLANARVFELADKASMKEASFMSTVLYGGQKLQSESEEVQVQFSIKSLNIPEIIIDMPETATIGELKRAVLESVTAVLHDGLRVGVILQGKKVKDDNKTLLQAGLSYGVRTDSLGFSLEPKKIRAQSQLTESKSPHYLPQYDSVGSLSRLPVADSDLPSSTNDLGRSLTECPGNYARYADKPAIEPPAVSTTLTDDDNSRALVAVPAMTMDTLAVVPFQRKSRRSELVQRRIRRPFSVAEVEALVQAVEVLGTGRWRDVKLRAFEDAKHRTYVDLKDKWKTLVHTARISPQQRRGEPVPQELLDRVLSAHAYWSNQQAKLQIKQHPEQNLLI